MVRIAPVEDKASRLARMAKKLAEMTEKHRKSLIIIAVFLVLSQVSVVVVNGIYTKFIYDVTTPLFSYLTSTENMTAGDEKKGIFAMASTPDPDFPISTEDMSSNEETNETFDMNEEEKNVANPYILCMWVLDIGTITGTGIATVATVFLVKFFCKRTDGTQAAAFLISMISMVWSIVLIVPLVLVGFYGKELPNQLNSLKENAARHNPEGERQLNAIWNCAIDGTSSSLITCESFISSSVIQVKQQLIIGFTLTVPFIAIIVWKKFIKKLFKSPDSTRTSAPASPTVHYHAHGHLHLHLHREDGQATQSTRDHRPRLCSVQNERVINPASSEDCPLITEVV